MRSRWRRVGACVMAFVIAFAVVLAATAGAQRVSLGWAWQNPVPLGRVARGVVRAGSFEYAIGDDGTLLRSSDGGADWSALDTGVDKPVSRLEVVDEATLVIGDESGCGTEISTNAGETFASIFNASRCLPVAAFSFVSPSVGFALLRDGAVERTTNGGRSFSTAAPIPGTPAEIGIEDEKHFLGSEDLGVELHFRTASSGIAFVKPSYGSSAAYATSDGGASWSPIALPATAEVENVDFVNEETAYAAGPGTLLYSSDAGATWQALAVAALNPEAVFCDTANGCLANLGLTTGIALHGAAAPTSYVAQLPLCAVAEQLPSQIITVDHRTASENASLVSGEASENCSPQSARAEIEYGGLRQGPGELVYAPVGNGYLALSGDEGRVWRTIATPSSELTDASFVDPREGITLDGHGVVHETEDGGASWRTLATGTKGAPRAVAMVGSHSVLALGASGIRRSNGSGPFAAVGGRAASAAHLFGFDVAGSTVFA
jgi:photosystem II stability/assembly factor-like uncharacterized protein